MLLAELSMILVLVLVAVSPATFMKSLVPIDYKWWHIGVDVFQWSDWCMPC